MTTSITQAKPLLTAAELERVHDLLSSNAKNARWTNCRLVLSQRSQFFHNLLFFSSHAKLRSTTQRLGITANLCSSLRLAICTVTSWPKASRAPSAKGSPVYPLSHSTLCTHPRLGLQRLSACSAPLRSVTPAVVTATACGKPWVSTAMWRLMPETFLPAS